MKIPTLRSIIAASPETWDKLESEIQDLDLSFVLTTALLLADERKYKESFVAMPLPQQWSWLHMTLTTNPAASSMTVHAMSGNYRYVVTIAPGKNETARVTYLFANNRSNAEPIFGSN